MKKLTHVLPQCRVDEDVYKVVIQIVKKEDRKIVDATRKLLKLGVEYYTQSEK